MTQPRDPAVQAMLDKQDIHDLLVRYCRAIDRADIDLLRACYHPDATEEHGGVFSGTASAYVDSIAPGLPKARVMSHAISNILVELTGPDSALAESYITAFARIKANGAYHDSLTLARAIDQVERRDGTWRIARRRMTFEWNHDMPMAETWLQGNLPGPSLIRGAKKPNDLLYQAG